MSFKLFIARTFGLIKSTEKIESAHQALLNDYNMFCEFEQSAIHKEYHELELEVNSPTFRQKKKEIQNLKLKGSMEQAQLTELRKLERNNRLKKFYATLNSDDLKRFIKISESETLAKYKELKTKVESHSIAALKKMDKTSPEYALYTDYQKLHDSTDLTFFRDFRKSSNYQNYELMSASPERKRYEELKKLTESAEFKAKVEYLEDNQKWEKCDAATKEKRYTEIRKLPELNNYLKYKNTNALDFFRKWNLVFEERFDSGKLDPEKWMHQFYVASQTLGQNFSQPGDLHAFTDGKNVSVSGKSMKIEVRREKTKSMQWEIPFGFVEHEFDYSSGVVSTGGMDWWKYGILEAKVKYSPNKNIVDVMYLLGDEGSPQINLVEMGVVNRLGLLSKTKNGIHHESESITGLRNGDFYIFRLEWTAQSLIWKVNDREILNLSHNVPGFKMHLNAASVVVNPPDGRLPHQFEIDWIKFYQHKH
jgi:hypothetical protein